MRCRASTCPALTAPAVARPAQDHYLPDLHHLRLELEEAATPEGHAVRFGFNPLEFENFSWRGYAQMTPIQVRAQCSWHDGWQRWAHGCGLSMTRRGCPDFLYSPTPLQPRIVAKLNLTSPDLFRLVFRYVNRGPMSVSGRVSVRDQGRFTTCPNCECWGCPLPTQLPPHPHAWVGRPDPSS